MLQSLPVNSEGNGYSLLYTHIEYYKKPNCTNGTYGVDPGYTFSLSREGELLDSQKMTIASSDKFCLENFIEDDFLISPLICHIGPAVINYESVGMTLSLPFLVTTFVVYALIDELQNLQGMSLMCYTATLSVNYMTFILVNGYVKRYYEKKIKNQFSTFGEYTFKLNYLLNYSSSSKCYLR